MKLGFETRLSFDEYSAWCRSRVPPFDPGPEPNGASGCAPTLLALGEDLGESPVTIRSTPDSCVVTPRPKGSY